MKSREIDEEEKMFDKLKDLLKNLKYGSITLVVQDGKVIQIEKNEKVRLK
ncbi:YezD family protein [Bacillus sp. FJAT-45350]|nr:YezD family protein [Bacillus sp. FJAT-45350]